MSLNWLVAECQDFNTRVITGINASRTDELGLNFNKIGLSVGLGTNRELAKNLLGEVQLFYNQKGHLGIPDSSGVRHTNLSLVYAEIALMLGYRIVPEVGIGTGISYGKLIRNSELIDDILYTYGPDEINQSDISLQISASYSLSRHFAAEITYSHQLNMLRNLTNLQSNTTISLRASYIFLHH